MRESARMVWPFLYYADERLTAPELMAARLDGDVIEIGEAFMPTDAVETRELRAGSLRSLLGVQVAATHESAAWIHGALHDPPTLHSVQRCAVTRIHHVIDARLRYRDLRLPECDGTVIAGVTVTTPPRTLVDLVRDRVIRGDGDPHAVAAMIAWQPDLIEAAIAWFEASGPIHHKRSTLAHLRSLAASG